MKRSKNNPKTTHDPDIYPRENLTKSFTLAGAWIAPGCKEISDTLSLGSGMPRCRHDDPSSSNRKCSRKHYPMKRNIFSEERGFLLQKSVWVFLSKVTLVKYPWDTEETQELYTGANISYDTEDPLRKRWCGGTYNCGSFELDERLSKNELLTGWGRYWEGSYQNPQRCLFYENSVYSSINHWNGAAAVFTGLLWLHGDWDESLMRAAGDSDRRLSCALM